MSGRVILRFLAVAGLLAGLACCLPAKLGAGLLREPTADPTPEPTTSIDKLLAREACFCLTFRPDDFAKDDLLNMMVRDMFDYMEQEFNATGVGIDRMTTASVGGDNVTIIRTRKPYDAEKMRKAHSQSLRHRFRGDDDDETAKPVFKEKKVGGNKIYYFDPINRRTRGYCPIDKSTFMVGPVRALETLLSTKGKPSPEMAGALAQGAKHSLVLALDGNRFRATLKKMREEEAKESKERGRMRKGGRFIDDDDDEDDKSKGADEVDELDQLFGDSWMFTNHGLPFKPLLSGKSSVLALDVKKGYTLTGKVQFNTKKEVEDGEVAIKVLLYSIRKLAGILPKREYGVRALQQLTAPIQKAVRNAKIERKDTTISVSMKLDLAAGMGKKIRDDILEEMKKRNERIRD